TGDLNPAHIDQVWAEKTMFKGRIAHGMLSAGLISAVLGMYLPGPGAIYLSQELKFLAPVRIGDTITARAEVIEIIEDKNRVSLKTTCCNQDGTVVVDGLARVMPPKANRD
ncbi:MaoC family dehydratase, partial [Chloroflexota bacterium]